MWHERMEHHGNPHEHIDLPVSATVYIAPTMEEAESETAGLEASINEEFYRIGNPADKDGNIPDNYKHWVHRDQDRLLAAERARQEGIRPLIGTPEVVCERLEVLRSKGINRIFGKFGAAGLDQGKWLRSIQMFAEEVMPEFAEEAIAAD
jgi:alkanesulfonate monooxygenase SsuD/methylene tetrahydromethanopterin reductase-like flavin-dependent oxidoreductase (luciferase family)